MHSKLTLRIKEPIIKAAKKYSKAHGKSISQLVSDYLSLVTHLEEIEIENQELPPITRSLQGILKGKKVTEQDYKKHLEDKYL